MTFDNIITRGKYATRNLHTEKNLSGEDVSIRGEVEVPDENNAPVWRDCVWNLKGNNLYPSNLMLDLIQDIRTL